MHQDHEILIDLPVKDHLRCRSTLLRPTHRAQPFNLSNHWMSAEKHRFLLPSPAFGHFGANINELAIGCWRSIEGGETEEDGWYQEGFEGW